MRKRPLGQIDAIRAVKDRPVAAVPAVVDRDGVRGRSRFWRNGLPRTGGAVPFLAKRATGFRISEAVRLRVGDFDFADGWIDVQRSKGGKSRRVPLPEGVAEELKRWVDSRTVLHRHDVEEGVAAVWLPEALSREYPADHRERK